MKTPGSMFVTAVAVLVATAWPAVAQISGINSVASSATIKFDDQNSFLGLNNGGLYSQSASSWTGSTLTLSQTDGTTGDSANGDILAFGSGASYNVALNNVSLSQPVGNTGFADLIFSFSVEYQLGGAWNSAPTFSPTFLVSGTVQSSSGSYASVRGQIDYYAVNTAGTYGIVDTVTYGWLYNTPGTFNNQTVSGIPSFGTLGNLVAGTTITMTGTLTFEVDPANLTVTTVPEPGTMALLGSGVAGLFVLRRRQAKN